MKLLTGDWIEQIACDDIQSPERANFDEIVYFGAAEDLLRDGKSYQLNEVSMNEKYHA